MKQVLRRRPTTGSTLLILSSTGMILFIVGVLFLTPLLLLLFDPQESRYALLFALPAALLMAAGSIAYLYSSRRKFTSLSILDGSIIVVLSWLISCAVSAIPIQRMAGLSYLQALFEAVSGWTTTGLSVLDVTSVPRLLLLWRSILQFAGGAGIAMIMVAAFSLPIGAGLYQAEGRAYQLVPNVIQSAKLVLVLYSGYAVLGIAALRAAGMSLFDAVNHTFAAISTGGFATRPENIGHWDSPVIEAIIIVLMLFGNLNFLNAYALVRGKLKAFIKNGEVKVMALVVPLAAFFLFLVVTRATFPLLGKSVRVAIFETVSALTTTGFSSVGYQGWPDPALFILSVLMVIGAGTCSTGGAMKQYRIYLLWKSIVWETKKVLMPRNAVIVHPVWHGEARTFIAESHLRQAGSFLFLYLLALAIGSMVISLHGHSFINALFEFSSSLGTVGLSIGITGPQTPPGILLTEIIGMLMGRFEFFVVFSSLGKLLSDFRRLIRS